MPAILTAMALAAAVYCPSSFRPRTPRPVPISADDYPEASLRAGEAGTVTVSFDVCPDGKASNCRVELSSGHNRLDVRTCELVERRGHVPPAVGVRQILVHEWRLPSD